MLLGPSGGGKTTILNCIAGLARPRSGRIAVASRVLFDSAERIDVPVAERRLGYLFQNLALFPHLTLEQNVQYEIKKLPARDQRERMMPLLDSFRISHLLSSKPNEVSGGERQRAALARSLVTNPALLLLDEPLNALDLATKATILDDLREWNVSHRIPILYVTHSPQEAFAVGEHCCYRGWPRHCQGDPARHTPHTRRRRWLKSRGSKTCSTQSYWRLTSGREPCSAA